jgi:hypothetical protein
MLNLIFSFPQQQSMTRDYLRPEPAFFAPAVFAPTVFAPTVFATPFRLLLFALTDVDAGSKATGFLAIALLSILAAAGLLVRAILAAFAFVVRAPFAPAFAAPVLLAPPLLGAFLSIEDAPL